jgi:hypothetical protein
VTLRDGSPSPSLVPPQGTEEAPSPPVRGLFSWAPVPPNSFRRVSSSLHWVQEVAFLISTGVEGAASHFSSIAPVCHACRHGLANDLGRRPDVRCSDACRLLSRDVWRGADHRAFRQRQLARLNPSHVSPYDGRGPKERDDPVGLLRHSGTLATIRCFSCAIQICSSPTARWLPEELSG